MSQGWIRDYRQELESDIWLMPPLYHRVWQWIKYNVNHEERFVPLKDGSKQKVERGQLMTSIRQIAQGVGWYEGRKWVEPNPKTIRSILKWMEQQDMISITAFRGNNGYTLITVVNWAVYQSKNNQGNIEHPFEKQRTDINKNDKNDKKKIDDNNAFGDPLPDPSESQLTEEQKLEVEIEDYYQTKRGRYGTPATQKDRMFIKQAIYKEKFTRDEIINGINLAFTQAGQINSFEYCLKVMRTERDRAQKKKVVPFKPVADKQNKLPQVFQPDYQAPQSTVTVDEVRRKRDEMMSKLKKKVGTEQ